jgi:hypothetical protein
MYRYFASEVFFRAIEKIGVRSQVPHALSWDHLQSILNKAYRVIYDQLTAGAKDKPYSETAEVTDLIPADAPNLFTAPVPQYARDFVLYSAVTKNSPRTILAQSFPTNTNTGNSRAILTLRTDLTIPILTGTIFSIIPGGRRLGSFSRVRMTM